MSIRKFAAVAGAAMFVLAVSAETLVWTGGGDNDYFSNPNNWNPVQAPASGDSLTFQGETRTTPYNDLDPASYTFNTITFANDYSSGKTKAFTLSGNKLKVSTAIYGVQPTTALTETFNLEVEFTGAATIGGSASKMSKHHFVFNKKVSGPSKRLSNSTEHAGSITFNGPISGFSDYYRPNGGSSIYLLGNNNAFTGTSGIHWGSGNLFIVDASNLNGATCFGSGQSNYATAGKLSVAPTNDVVLNLKLNVAGPSQGNNGLTIENTKEGPTLTIAGEVALAGTKEGVGSRLTIVGAGDGAFTGKFSAKNMAIRKEGTGTWTLSGDIPSFAPTGLVEVTAGKLCIDCATPTYAAAVSKGATLTGSGSLGKAAFPATVTFASGSKYEVRTLTDGSVSALAVTGTVSLAGTVQIDLKGSAELKPGTSTLLLAYSALTGTGSFKAGTGFPSDTVLRNTGTALYADVPTETKTWSGTVSTEWNRTDANWGDAVYEDGSPVVFPDLADASKRNVTVPDTVKPLTVTVASQADRSYGFTGDGSVEGVSLIDFTGTATNVWDVALSDITALWVHAGKLLLNGPVENSSLTVYSGASLELGGKLTDSSVYVESGASFKQSATSSLCGASSITLLNGTSDLYGTNDFTGGLTLGQIPSGPATTTARIRAPMSLGAGGDFTLNYISYLSCMANVTVSNRVLHIHGYNNNGGIAVDSGHTLEWAGDIYVHEHPNAESVVGGNGTHRLGKRDGTSVFEVVDGRALTFVPGATHLYAAYKSTGALGFRGTLYLYNSKNSWDFLGINSGTCHTMADNVLPADKPIRLLQIWGTTKYTAALNLNGTSQTVAKITTSYTQGIGDTATFTSTQPATLTVKNKEDFSYSDPVAFLVKGAVTLCKKGSAKWTLGVNNTSSGDLEVMEGTLAVTDALSFPTGKKSVFRIAEGATLELADGVAGEIAYGVRIAGGRELVLEPGVYGGPDCVISGVTKVDWITGTGTLRIRKILNGGIIFLVQ